MGFPTPLYFPDLTPANLFLSPMLKKELAGLSLSLEEFRIK
jgi:hypothetical protein